MFEKLYHDLLAWFYPLYKFVLHILTGKSEIERICTFIDNGRHTTKMMKSFTKSLKYSRQLSSEAKRILYVISGTETFSAVLFSDRILSMKGMSNVKPLIKANVRNSLKSLRLLLVLQKRIIDLKNTTFSYENKNHLDLLNRLWNGLKPEIRRRSLTTLPSSSSSSSIHQSHFSEDWKEIGFQHYDPSSDFRGMGLFGLIQLVYFIEHYPSDSLRLSQQLLIPSNNSKYLPFAITSINLSSFVSECLEEHHFHNYFFERMDEIILQDSMNSIEGCSEDEQCILFTINIIHHLYCKLFLQFGISWIESPASNMMDFPRIFGRFKEEIKQEYPAI
jgi:hypothetical protein